MPDRWEWQKALRGYVFVHSRRDYRAVTSNAPCAVKVGMETGPLAVWHWHELRRAGLPVVCLHARHAKAALSVQLNKTDANDAFGLAQIVGTGWYREVEIKSLESHTLR